LSQSPRRCARSRDRRLGDFGHRHSPLEIRGNERGPPIDRFKARLEQFDARPNRFGTRLYELSRRRNDFVRLPNDVDNRLDRCVNPTRSRRHRLNHFRIRLNWVANRLNEFGEPCEGAAVCTAVSLEQATGSPVERSVLESSRALGFLYLK
jgi:hypothetical protein